MGFAALLFTLIKPTQTLAQPDASVSMQTFYDELTPYGTWIDDPDFGSVWVPNVDDGFRPYATNGYWAMTEYGNTWVSNYDWGWAAFHYGRWRFDDYYGWEWIPDTEWGPAWVNWRTGGGYYVWAPLGPNVSLDVAFDNNYYVPDDYWICAPRMYINSPYIYNYYVPRERAVVVIRNTTIINNVYVANNVRFVTGPRPYEIQRYTHRPVTILQINNVGRPGVTIVQNRTVNIYRPTVIKVTDDYNRPRPAVVVDANAYRNAHPYNGIANHTNGATVNHTNAAILLQTANSPQAQNSGFVHVNRPSPNNAPANGGSPANNSYDSRRGNRPAQNGMPSTGGNPDNNNYDPQHRGNRPLQGSPTLVPPVNTAPASSPAPTNTAPTTAPAYNGGGYYRRGRQSAPVNGTPAPTSTPAVTPSQPQAQPQAQPQNTQPQAQPQRQPGQYYRRTQPQQQPQQQSQPAPQQQPQRQQPQSQPAPQQQPQRTQPQQQQPQRQQPPAPQQQQPQRQQQPQQKPQPRPVRKDVPPPTVQQ
jgi:hypothetical protein